MASNPNYYLTKHPTIEKYTNCDCKNSVVVPGVQLDDPWCGCGWLLMCALCGGNVFVAVPRRSSYWTPARVAKMRMKLLKSLTDTLSKKDVSEWERGVEEDLAGISAQLAESPTNPVVYFDGLVLPLTARCVKMTGLFAEHEFPEMPHLAALGGGDMPAPYCDSTYWKEHRTTAGGTIAATYRDARA